MSKVNCWPILALTVLLPGGWQPARSQPVIRTVFPPEEYAARRARLFDAISDGIAVLEGTTDRPGEQPFRQANQFNYLTGVAEPRALALLDGRTRTVAIFLPAADPRDAASKFGPGALVPGEAAAQALGVAQVLPREGFAAMLAGVAKEGRVIFTPFRPEVLGSASSYDTVHLAQAVRDDPWDGRPSREEAFRLALMRAAPRSELRDLDPIIDDLRAIKSPREIAVIREATRLAEAGTVRAIRVARPGMREYELQAEAEYVFKQGGAYGSAYFALVATGPNSWYTHYHYNIATLSAGDIVEYDYAPDYRGYVSDLARVFPAGRTFTPRQREAYDIYLRLYRALMASIRVHETPEAVAARAVQRMDAIVAAFPFTDPAIRSAVKTFVDGFRGKDGWLGHAVGMEVHDTYGRYKTLEPGMVFTIEPMLRLPDDHIAIRLEDMLLITPAGVENMSAGLPIEPDAIEHLRRGRARERTARHTVGAAPHIHPAACRTDVLSASMKGGQARKTVRSQTPRLIAEI